MDKSRHLKVICEIALEYLRGSATLAVLIQKEGLRDILPDDDFRAAVFDDLLALDEVYARTRTGDFDFAKDGKPIVDSAVRAIISKSSITPELLCRADWDCRSCGKERRQ